MIQLSPPLRENSELTIQPAQLLALEEKFRQHSKNNERRLTIPAIFQRSSDENFISDYLAYILNPEQNGIGIEPLQALLSLAYGDTEDIEIDQAVFIQREYAFKKRPYCGRIDFIIELGGDNVEGIIGIENKIYSSEGSNQTGSYVDGIQGDYPGCRRYMIFLTPQGSSPSSSEFKPVSYADLARALRDLRYPVLSDIHKTVIWEDFLYHLEEYIIMANGRMELSPNARLYLEHIEMMEGLNRAYQDASQKVYDYVIGSIKNYFGEGWNYAMQGRNGFQEVHRQSWNLGKYYVFYQFFFSRDSLLTKNQFSLMLGVYPSNPDSRQFLEWIKVNKPEIKEICANFDMEAYPLKVQGTGSHLFAYKVYPIVFDKEDLSKFDQQFIQALNQFSNFTPLIDDAVKTFLANENA